MSPDFKAHQLANGAVQVLMDYVWPEVQSIAKTEGVQLEPLRARIGAGKRTYQELRLEKGEHVIVFGERSISSWCDSEAALQTHFAQDVVEHKRFELDRDSLTLGAVVTNAVIILSAEALASASEQAVKPDEGRALDYLDLLHHEVGEHALMAFAHLAESRKISLEFDDESEPQALLRPSELAVGCLYGFRMGDDSYEGVLIKVSKKTAEFQVEKKRIRAPTISIYKLEGEVYEVPEQPESNDKVRGVIDRFEGRYHFLASDFKAPFRYKGIRFDTALQLYLYLTIDPTQDWWRQQVVNAETPEEAQRYWNDNRCPKIQISDWDGARFSAMKRAIWEKFREKDELIDRLLATESMDLIATSDSEDTFFGVVDGEGENHEGEILMAMRSHFQNAEKELKAG
jgi:predicted NAD-dependent protein-ADP-ribosyltransferase YbiA (DUF1768 family)